MTLRGAWRAPLLAALVLTAGPWLAFAGPTYTPPGVTPGAVGTTSIADDSVTYAKMQNATATDRLLCRDTSGAGDWEECAPSAARAIVGFSDETVYPQRVVLTGGDVSDSTSAGETATGLAFTPSQVSGVYYVEVRGVFTGAVNTTGLQWRIDPGNGTGGGAFTTRGTSLTTLSTFAGQLDGSTMVLGTSSASAAGETPFWGWAIITAAGAAPTAVTVYINTEIDTSAVTVKSGKCVLFYQRISG